MKDNFSFIKGTLLLAFLFALGIPNAICQDDEALSPVTDTYAITGATIVVAPGQVIPKGTVVVEKGLISAVGTNITIPPNALTIKADSMFVYAGFIDGLSRTGVSKPKKENSEKVKYPADPPPDRAGITPQQDVRDFLTPTDRTVADLRSSGFIVSQVAPHGSMLPGQTAVVLLGGKTADEMVLVPHSSLYSELTGTPGVYPSTIMGVMAKWRELYRQAMLSKNYEATYASNPQGLQRPASDQILNAFYPVIDGRMPVLIQSEKVIETQRAIALKNDLGFKLILADLQEGWPIVDKLKKSGASIYLSLALPEEKKTDKNDSTFSEERKALEKRKSESIQKYVAQASQLQSAGIRFGFSANSVQPKDIQPNIRRMIAAGLNEDAALASLTTIPAQMMGLTATLGTVEKGKLANLVITDKSYFAEKSKVKKVFVEGKLYTVEEKSGSGDNKKVDIKGSWTYSTDTPQGKGGGKLVIRDSGGTYNGTITNNFSGQETLVKDIVLEGNSLSFSYVIDVSGNSLKIDVTAKVNGNSFDGSMTAGQYGTFPLTASKDPN